MKFYEIELKSVPLINFALSVDVEKHKNRFDFIDGFLEICVIEEGCVVHRNFDGTGLTVEPGMISCVTSLDGFESHSKEGQRQCHTTVGIVGEYTVTAHDTASGCDVSALCERAKQGRIVLLPGHIFLNGDYDKVISIIKTISRLNLSTYPGDKLKAVGNWYILAGVLTDITLKLLDNSDKKHAPSDEIYVEKAVRYINEHYKEKITVPLIAQQLGISDGHLHRIFKNVKSMSVIAYINNLKVSTAISLMKNRGLILQDAAYNVGIEDPSYMSRLFKNVTGLSSREYMKKSEMLRK